MKLTAQDKKHLIPVLVFGRVWPGLMQIELKDNHWHVFLYDQYIGHGDNGLQVYCNYLDYQRILTDELESLKALQKLGRLSDVEILMFTLGMMRGVQ